jgi:hypothetical protein
VELAGGTCARKASTLEDDLRHHPDARVAGSYLPDMGTAGPVVDGLGRAVVVNS